tara:strand:+ start:80 stop:226 length:147 start_codon:yes stop_codon:yes gene_type:complete
MTSKFFGNRFDKVNSKKKAVKKASKNNNLKNQVNRTKSTGVRKVGRGS